MSDILCSVSNCYFWKQSNHCGAPAIMVTTNGHANAKFREEIAKEITVDYKLTEPSNSPVETCCHTFRAR